MKRLVMMVLLLFAASFAWAQPYKVGVHSFHTVTYSDGTWTFQTATKLAKAKGFNALVCCDHIEKIAKKSSFKNYLMDCEKNYGITIIPGVEVTVENCHTIVFGNLTVEALEKLNGAKTVKEVIALAIEYSLLTVAAHPFNKKYLYPFDLANGISGQEWFNDEGGKYEKNLELSKQAITSAWPIFNSAGIDSHAIADPQDRVRWQRLTWVFANSSSREDLLIAFKNGQTIASCSNYQLEGLNIIPGFDDKAIEPRFQFKVKSSDLVTAVRRVRIYRDNIVIMTRQIKPDSASKAFDFFDKDCPEGLHTYVIEVEKMLITSPICLEVNKKLLFKVPSFCRKAINEIRAIMGEPSSVITSQGGTDSESSWWYFNDKPARSYRLEVSTCVFASRVGQVFWQANDYMDDNSWLTPRQVVPDYILDSKPYGKYLCPSYNYLQVLWYLDGNTYGVTVTAKEKIYKRNLFGGYELNEIVRDWKNCNLVLWTEEEGHRNNLDIKME